MMNPLRLMLFWCIVLISFRCWYYDHSGILFMGWNLFLACLPLLFTRFARVRSKRMTKWLWFSVALLFLPNAPYMVTDLLHLNEDLRAPLWYDSVLFISCACCGMWLFFRAINDLLAYLLSGVKSPFGKEAATFGLMLLTAYGIYLGRWLRLNSWDLLRHPRWLMRSLLESVSPDEITFSGSITLFYGAFLYVSYTIYRGMHHIDQVSVESKLNASQ